VKERVYQLTKKWFFSILILLYTAEYYDNGHCRSCHSTCETCMGPTENDCLTCSNNLLLQNNKCVSTCDKGYFMEAGVCTICLHTCTQCVSRMNCTECVKGLQLQSGECRATCADGWEYSLSWDEQKISINFTSQLLQWSWDVCEMLFELWHMQWSSKRSMCEMSKRMEVSSWRMSPWVSWGFFQNWIWMSKVSPLL